MPNVFSARAVTAGELSRLAAAIDGSYMFPTAAGGAVTPSSGMTIAIAAISANIVTVNSALVTVAYAGGTVAATAADATNPRRDLVYYDTSGNVDISAGSPAAIPHVPTLTATQIALAELYVAANDTSIDAGDITDRRQQVTGAKRSSGGGTFLIPTGPAAGTNVPSSASANTYGAWTEMVASTAAALYIVGLVFSHPDATANTYAQWDIGTGAGGAETSVGEFKFDMPGATLNGEVYMLPYPIPVAASTRIAARMADDEAAADTGELTLICINQSDVVTY